MLTAMADLLMHSPLVWWLLLKLGLVSEGLHDLFCERDCEVAALAW